MLNKLIKYDFKWINKTMHVYFIVLFIISVAVKVVESLDQTLLIVIVDKIVSGMFISCIISLVITCFMRIWGRFISNIYKDESYLTHTLPVTKNQIFNAKMVASILSLLLSAIVIVACIAFTFVNNSTIETLKFMWESLVEVYGGFVAVCFVIGITLTILLEAGFFMLTGIFGIVVGHMSNNHKIVKSIIVGIVSYGILSSVIFIVLLIVSNFANFEIVAGGFPDLRTLKIMGLTAIIVYFVIDFAYYCIIKLLLNKGVNVD